VPDDRAATSATSAAGTLLAVELVIRDEKWAALGDMAALVDAAATAVAAAFDDDPEKLTATVALADDAEVRRLNATWRGKDKATNVLSFPSPDNQAEPGFLGDVVLARETVVSEARDLDVPLSHHFQHLVVHGLLHLLGYDHETDAEAEEMESLETAILAGLGVPDPYAGTELVGT